MKCLGTVKSQVVQKRDKNGSSDVYFIPCWNTWVYFYREAISLITSTKMSIPFRKMFSFKNSLWSWRRIGVWFIGENPRAGNPTSRMYLLSVAAGKMVGTIFNWCLSVAFLKALNQGSSSDTEVIVWSVNFWRNSISIPSPALKKRKHWWDHYG